MESLCSVIWESTHTWKGDTLLSSGMASQMRFLLFFECFETLGLVEGRLVSVPTGGNLTYLTRPSPVNKRGSWACLYKERRSWGWQRHGKDSFHSSRKSAPGAHSTWTSAAHAQEPQKWSTTWLHTMSNLCKSIRNPLINLKSRTHAYNFQIRQRDKPAGLRCGLGRWLTFPNAAMRSQISDDVL